MIRGLLTVGIVAMALVPCGANAAGPLDGRCVSRITVDSRELRDKGGGGAADVLDKQLPQELRDVFGNRVGCRGGLALVVRLQTISLSYAVGAGPFPVDSLKGESILLDERGRVIDTYPLIARASSDVDGPLYGTDTPEVRSRRVKNLAGAFAGWLKVHYGS
jgi:hypothetical protein